MKRFVLLAFIIGPVLLAQEDIKRDIAKIAAMQNDIERLAAFDSFAGKLGLTPNSKTESESAGKWKISTNTSPIDDSQTVTAALITDTPIGTGFLQVQPTLFLRYSEGEIAAYVAYGLFLGSDHINVTVRFGKGAAEAQSWDISTNGKSAFVPGDALSFMKRLATADSFLIRATPFGESPVTVSFSLSGVEKVIDAIQKAEAANPKNPPPISNQKTEAAHEAQAKSRPRLTAPRTTILTNRVTGVSNLGIVGMDARWSEYGEYLQEFVEIVQTQWHRILEESRVSPPRGSHVIITFKINSKGETDIVKVEDSDAGKLGVFSCQSAIQAKQPYRQWTEQMIAGLGDEQSLTFAFYYQ